MRFWDSSALVPLLVEESTSTQLEQLFQDQNGVAVWWATEVECASAVARLERMDLLGFDDSNQALRQLDCLAEVWHVIVPVETVRATARRFLRVHDLRAADALQLGAAFALAEGRPASLAVVSLDERLAAAAKREGFRVIDRRALNAGLTPPPPTTHAE